MEAGGPSALTAPQILGYFGHHKCGTQWVKAILQDIAHALTLTCVVYNNPRQFGGDLQKAIADQGVRFFLYVNAEQRYVASLIRYRGFHMVRDPRDIAVSAYYSHLYSHPIGTWWPELVRYRDELQELDHDAGLMRELEELAPQFHNMSCWNYANPNILEVRMEHVTHDPLGWFERIFDFLGILHREDEARRTGTALSRETLIRILDKNSFSALAGGRDRGEEDIRSHYRKGVSGDWASHFGAAHVDYFKEHYNNLLLDLGYEHRADW
jgi:Sulfotransferase domain